MNPLSGFVQQSRYERKISEASLPALTGSQAAAPREQSAGSVTISGSSIVKKDRGHEDHGQTIHNLFELASSSRATRYFNVPPGGSVTIEPGKFSHYILRTQGDVSITLAKPPAVPEDQKTKTGRFRTRNWDVLIQISNRGADGIVTWSPTPGTSNNIAMPGDVDPETGQREVVFGPDFPGVGGGISAGGLTDFLWLHYSERVAFWFGTALVRNAAGVDDPIDPSEEATEPGEDPEAPPQDGDGTAQETEDEYTDPENGQTLEAEAPKARPGNLIALGLSGLVITEDCGATWKQPVFSGQTLPISNADISSLGQGLGTIVQRADGKVIVSQDLVAWTELSLPSRGRVVDGLTNGNFEAGFLDGWDLLDGTEPLVVDTEQPAQIGESVYYLTNDRAAAMSDFRITQPYSPPIFDPSDDDTLTFSADMFAEDGAKARLSIIDGREYVQAGVFAFTLSGGVFTAENFATSPKHGPLRLRMTSVGPRVGTLSVSSGNGIAIIGNAGQQVMDTFNCRIEKSDGSLYPGTVGLRIYDLDTNNGGTERLVFPAGIEQFDTEGKGVTATQSGSTITFVGVPEAVGESGLAARNGRGSFFIEVRSSFSYTFTATRQGGIFFANSAELRGIREYAFTEWDQPSFETRIFQVRARNIPVDVLIVSEGQGTSPATSVFIDNIQVSYDPKFADRTNAICSDRVYPGTRHVLCGEQSMSHIILGPSGQRTIEQIGFTPFPAELVGARGNFIAIASGSTYALSLDGGQNFTETFLGRRVVQILSEPAIIVVSEIGQAEIFDGTRGGESVAVFNIPGGPGSRLAYDRSRRWLVAVSPKGTVHAARIGPIAPGMTVSFELVGAQPEVNTSIPGAIAHSKRRVFAANIGRLFGFEEGKRDLFYADDPAKWMLSKSLTVGLKKIVEVF